ncbi:hypothetical protein Poli38472_012415 [Pythium oligandrum]|uniref:Protein kinase domain-containing protein n=1 Tax=Pythium oligandrum TaxID=41045 RepID=A0A8K1CPM5_PYTOL|nr:hypothetical protein Poli38472_012415 [Pythium oligandrum]|eukprot:TMW67299.1 hypothetical protein Poli38472_012415 [Pythium oligandrum]
MHDGRTQIYKYSPFSFVVDGVNAGLEQFCKSDDCFDLYMLFRKINNGFSLLAKFQRSGSHELGFDPDKVKNALHVAHALTYMHSFQPVVLHRDLKSRNILLDNELNAKLTDFEVMMGKRYDEKADVFSFGVVLSELDLHELPYAHAVESGTGRKLPDTVIVHMVSIGRLQVEFVNPTKSEMAKVGLDCIALDPTARPTAAEVLNRVHQIWLRHQQL